ncbi:hypothetical protein IQ288_31230 [Burkholderia sp. R-69980]|nr:hypothetical protein [Burkholderia sp. R-69980]
MRELAAMMRWPVPWFVPALALLTIGVGAVVTYLRTAFTEIVIDTARITLRGQFKKAAPYA